MPLTPKGKKILQSMKAQYGPDKGEEVFYASINAGKITGAEKGRRRASVLHGLNGERAKQEKNHYSQYGDVEYADKKHHKYPIDTKKHVKAAWSYINMPKNQKFYSASELQTIKGHIKAAAKKFGIEISEGSNRNWF